MVDEIEIEISLLQEILEALVMLRKTVAPSLRPSLLWPSQTL